MKKLTLFLLSVAMLVSVFVTPVFAAKEQFMIVEEVDLQLTAPVAGNRLDFTADVLTENANYEATEIDWFVSFEDETWYASEGDTAIPGAIYRASITVEGAMNGTKQYRFLDETVATVNGEKAPFETHNNYRSGLCRIYFPMVISTITSVNVPVTAPEAGNKPDYDVFTTLGYYTDNGGNNPAVYKNGFYWYDETDQKSMTPGTGDVFKEGHTYTVRVILIAQNGYKFDENLKGIIDSTPTTPEWISEESVAVEFTYTLDHDHSESDWKSDKTDHWKECSECGEVLNKDTHKDSNKDGVCDTCSYKMATATNSDSTDKNTNNSTSKPQQSQSTVTESSKPEPEVSKPETEVSKPETKPQANNSNQDIPNEDSNETDIPETEKPGQNAEDITIGVNEENESKGNKLIGGALVFILVPAIIWVAAWIISIIAIIKNAKRKKGE